MTIYRLQTSLQSDSGLPRDQFVNSLYVEDPSVLPPIFTTWTANLTTVYGALLPFLSPVIAQNGHTFKIYQIGLPLESPPVFTQTWNLSSAPGGTALPNEVASVLTFRGPLHAGWNRQSVYGRIYLGPLNTTASQTVTGGGAIVSDAFRGEAVPKMGTWAADINAVGSKWVVYSKLHLGTTVVNTISMDNEWDTVRSRGYRATAKTSLGITQP